MSLVWKRRVVITVLALFTAWPLAHRWFTVRYEVSPWRLFGWAMYCTPVLAVEIGVVPERDGRMTDVALPQDVRRQVSQFAERRKALGRLARPEPLARTILNSVDVDAVVLTIQHNHLDPASARIRGRRDYFRFRRDAAGDLIGGRFDTRDLAPGDP